MKFFLQKLLSYAMPIRIHTGMSELGFAIELWLKQGRYCLDTPNATYSYDDRYTALSQPFADLNIENRTINNVLILGFGLGSAVVLLEKMQPNQQFAIVGIDADAAIIALAKKYKNYKSNITLIHGDALHYNELIVNKKMDLIIVDVFADHRTPYDFNSIAFTQKLMGSLDNKGICLINRWNETADSSKVNTDYYEQIIKKTTSNYQTIHYGTTQIIVFEK